MTIYGMCEVDVTETDPETGKPIVTITFSDKLTIRITTNLGEMIGGVSAGTRLRWEDQHEQRH